MLPSRSLHSSMSRSQVAEHLALGSQHRCNRVQRKEDPPDLRSACYSGAASQKPPDDGRLYYYRDFGGFVPYLFKLGGAPTFLDAHPLRVER